MKTIAQLLEMASHLCSWNNVPDQFKPAFVGLMRRGLVERDKSDNRFDLTEAGEQMLAASKAATALGSMTSDRKKQTSAENGRKGGRPKGLGYIVRCGDRFQQNADNLREARKIANGLRDRRSPDTIRIIKILPEEQKTVESFAAAS